MVTFEEITEKFESINFPNGGDPSKWVDADIEFEEYLSGSGWTYDSWLDELCRRVNIL